MHLTNLVETHAYYYCILFRNKLQGAYVFCAGHVMLSVTSVMQLTRMPYLGNPAKTANE